MCKITKLRLNSQDEYFDYSFSNTNFIFGPNTVGKTAMAITLDTVFAKSKNKAFEYADCLINVDSIDIKLENKSHSKWFRRSRNNNFYIKDGDEGDFQQVDIDYYKNEIEKFYSVSDNYKEVYEDIYGETLTFRSFSFLNFLDENDIGNLNDVFTRAKDYEHIYRIRNLMQMLFNYENIKKIYDNDILIKNLQKEVEVLKYSEQNFNYNVNIIKDCFNKLNLKFSQDMNENYNVFLKYKNSFNRDKLIDSKNYIDMLKISLNISEEIKILEFKNKQTQSLKTRNYKSTKLMGVLSNLLNSNPEFEEYINVLKSSIDKKNDDNIILSSIDYKESLNKLKKYKEKIDKKLESMANLSNELSIDEILKNLGMIDNAFKYTLLDVDYNQYEKKKEEIKKLQDKNKVLRSSFSKDRIDEFNKQLTTMYLNSELNVKCVKEDLKKENFKILFDPIKILIHQNNPQVDVEEIASKSRMTFIQMLCYIEFFNFIKKDFSGLCVLPFIILDGASTQFDEHFEEVCDYISTLSKNFGLQTFIFSFKEKNNKDNCSYIDISNGFNPFHHKI